ncbi:MAG TPA: bifunctional phosphopantothenoylcysteine decarboxylase/phosphopantothenate--cysteine ligase CoaBC [Bellilinea sp.]|nr:bifunctional phosphopantothenoylcysteine decarboxylase/phosphopantothenate--cysteine ligase CoaBC [Bellilinea sp.]
MPNPLTNKHVILGVTGSIANYKAAEIASRLTQVGAFVDVILTESATKFITPLTFQSVTGRKVYVDADLWGGEGHVTHVGLGRAAELMIIAPVSANTIARLANGFGDNLLVLTALASHCPIVLAPAMDVGMFEHPATQANVKVLQERGVHFIGPAEGHLASGLTGRGRMVEPLEVIGAARRALGRKGPLAGKKVVVTAGGTQEPIDPVRLVTNRSSGKQGFAIAWAAQDAGADVTLITTKEVSSPGFAKVIPVETAAEMHAAVMQETTNADLLVMAAAVADFRPATASVHKIKKEKGLPEIIMEPTIDILQAVGEEREKTGWPKRVIGFAAESRDLLDNAAAKLQRKKLDMIVANDITRADAGFEVNTNKVTFLYPDGTTIPLPKITKDEVAEALIDRSLVWFKNS